MKKTLTLISTAVLSLLFAGCSSNNSSTDNILTAISGKTIRLTSDTGEVFPQPVLTATGAAVDANNLIEQSIQELILTVNSTIADNALNTTNIGVSRSFVGINDATQSATLGATVALTTGTLTYDSAKGTLTIALGSVSVSATAANNAAANRYPRTLTLRGLSRIANTNDWRFSAVSTRADNGAANEIRETFYTGVLSIDS